MREALELLKTSEEIDSQGCQVWVDGGLEGAGGGKYISDPAGAPLDVASILGVEGHTILHTTVSEHSAIVSAAHVAVTAVPVAGALLDGACVLGDERL